MQTQRFATCFVEYDTNTFVIGNECIKRTWRFVAGYPVPTSVTDIIAQKEWLLGKNNVGTHLSGLGPCVGAPEIGTDNDHGLSQEGLRARIPFAHPAGVFYWTHTVYPGVPFVRTCWEFEPGCVETDSTAPSSAEQRPVTDQSDVPAAITAPKETTQPATAPPDTLDSFTLAPLHVRWEAVCLRDVTDKHNNLVSVVSGLLYGSEERKLQGNLLFMREVLDGSGLLLVKESPTPMGHLHYPGHDFLLQGNQVMVQGSGVAASDFAANEPFQTYGVAVGVSQNGESGSLLALQKYHQALRQAEPVRDFYVMSNTWGDRSQDSRVNEAFVLAELPVAARLGVSIYQIDDGWQKGRTSNSSLPGGTWEGFYAADPHFWDPHPERFPRGLKPVAVKAHQLGIRLGLWFAPDSTADFAHWQQDAAVLFHLYKEYGVTHFKLDSVKLRSKVGEARFIRLMQQVYERTEGQVSFNLDTTAEVRLGYYGRSHYGNLFLENRYTDWHNYFPHRTLRNLWMLSRYFPSNRLQMEFLNVRRNTEKYGDDPLAPASVGLLYAFGVTVCANPLVWMEVTGLTEEDQDLLAKVIPAYLTHQAAMLGGITLPIGAEPDGTAWTGFQCMTDDRSGYLAIYRERNRSTRNRFRLWQLENCRLELEPVVGAGQERRLEVDNRGETWITLPHPMSFALYKYTRH